MATGRRPKDHDEHPDEVVGQGQGQLRLKDSVVAAKMVASVERVVRIVRRLWRQDDPLAEWCVPTSFTISVSGSILVGLAEILIHGDAWGRVWVLTAAMQRKKYTCHRCGVEGGARCYRRQGLTEKPAAELEETRPRSRRVPLKCGGPSSTHSLPNANLPATSWDC